ncbi:MAG: M67 family metallopeptidase [Candidatus Dormibacteraeota bacterium]|nr:M67 family metallopeptidase [Candidatus Dormibacteraeota bacterium]
MRRLGEAAYPYEGCGILVGRPGTTPEVTEVRPATNTRGPEDRGRDRYLMDPGDIVRAQHAADDAGLDIVGFWHTHPDHPSRPSQYDADHAWPGYVYVIISVQQGRAAGEQGWVLETESPPAFGEQALTD